VSGAEVERQTVEIVRQVAASRADSRGHQARALLQLDVAPGG
jgi:hypothetical protein